MYKKIFLGFIVFVLILCFVACKDTEVYLSDTSSNNDKGTSVPIVIVDDENDEELTQSEIDEITEGWEDNNPTVSIEIGTSDKDDNSNTSSDNEKENSSGNSSNVTTSEKEDNNDETSSNDDSNEENSSSDKENTESDKEDDGYFDVAV